MATIVKEPKLLLAYKTPLEIVISQEVFFMFSLSLSYSTVTDFAKLRGLSTSQPLVIDA
jgi:hypothetical protein